MLIVIVLTTVIIIFGIAAFIGAPYLPTLKIQTKSAIDLLGLSKGQTLLDLGCGDGRVLKFAARSGINSIGYEINPILVIIAKINTIKYRSHVKIYWSNYWTKPLPKADGIFIFLIDKYMQKLSIKLADYEHKPIKIVSFAFQIPDKKANTHRDGLYLYEYL